MIGSHTTINSSTCHWWLNAVDHHSCCGGCRHHASLDITLIVTDITTGRSLGRHQKESSSFSDHRLHTIKNKATNLKTIHSSVPLAPVSKSFVQGDVSGVDNPLLADPSYKIRHCFVLLQRFQAPIVQRQLLVVGHSPVQLCV
jgi:hypothetical protein